MTVDIEKYSASKRLVINFFEAKGGRRIGYTISMGAQMYGVPCIVIAYWLGDMNGWPQEAIDAIVHLKHFYGYGEITGKPEGSPI